MKTPSLIRLVAGLSLLLWSGLVSTSLAQENRFIIEPVNPSPATQHPQLVNTVLAAGGDIYQEVDFPAVNGNLVAALMDPLEANDLRQSRPDLRVIRDDGVEPDGGAGTLWSPDRIDQRVGTDTLYLPPMVDPCDEDRPYVYICDTGVLQVHDEFSAASPRLSLVDAYVPALLLPCRTVPAWEDPWDHGTGVASCAVGETLGAGRCPANLVSAVCYPDPGAFAAATFASFAADVIYWSLNEHNLRALDDDPYNDASVLIFASSTTTGPSVTLDLAVQRAYLGGMTVVVSAGNTSQDLGAAVPPLPSPAAAFSGSLGDITLTVAASTALDARWAGSNYGVRAELFAPGENVPVASSAGANVCMIASGTSYSAGYAGGAAARILARNPWATPAEVATVLTDPLDLSYGPSGPFGAGMNGVPKLLYVNPTSGPCVPLDFATWTGLYTTDPADPLADRDGDELVDGVEYFMALDPFAGDATADQPSLTLGASEVEFRFRKANYLCGSVMYELQCSTDLLTWNAVSSALITTDPNAPCDDVATWMVASIPTSGGRMYVRLTVLGL